MNLPRDYSDKSWLRPTPSMFRRLLQIAADTLTLAAFLFLLAWAISANEARASQSFRLLLEASSQPATLDECQRAAPHRGRPVHVVSFQSATGHWHRRTCTWRAV